MGTGDGELLSLSELCVDVICANLLRFEAGSGSHDGEEAEAQEGEGEGEEGGGGGVVGGDGGPPGSWPRPFKGLPPELVDRLLRSLVAHRCLLPQTLAVLSGCEVTTLDLSSCRGVEDDWLTPFAAAELTDLILRGAAGVTDAGLGRLEGLRHLQRVDLSQCLGVQGEGLRQALRQTDQLRSVNLSGCLNLTDVGLEPLVASAASLRALSLQGCRRLTAAALRRTLSQLRALETLSLNQCQGLASDAHALTACLAALPALRQVDLGYIGSAISPGVLVALSSTAEGLETLVLDRASELGSAGLAALGPLARLRRLSLRGCLGVTDGGLSYLPTSLEELNLSHCRGETTDPNLESRISNAASIK